MHNKAAKLIVIFVKGELFLHLLTTGQEINFNGIVCNLRQQARWSGVNCFIKKTMKASNVRTFII
jgi:hypothetical protein